MALESDVEDEIEVLLQVFPRHDVAGLTKAACQKRKTDDDSATVGPSMKRARLDDGGSLISGLHGTRQSCYSASRQSAHVTLDRLFESGVPVELVNLHLETVHGHSVGPSHWFYPRRILRSAIGATRIQAEWIRARNRPPFL
ncbi:uncharacterized protein EI90DRAFT_3122257 [Cantharellus anzutake]|uniref:uncharacterized protein n=1 Tax=Cantharellus anzutake TaxID=1750568 RepID=UPI001905BD58|nr:uncharacterized protein EI90DRAFT_3122257 [Cantharellus anzutake]KAF8333203.1 hypothetical protein EI90DRAFT_3122257 [Cantharellus anzutake]